MWIRIITYSLKLIKLINQVWNIHSNVRLTFFRLQNKFMRRWIKGYNLATDIRKEAIELTNQEWNIHNQE